jgi:hypothetical protein
MPDILCPRCFMQFPPWRLEFRCLHHRPTPIRFRWVVDGDLHSPPARAMCPRGGHLTGIRLCPHCHSVLPYYTGRASDRIIGLIGCSNSGKTVYLWSLLYELRGRLARESTPFAAAMFENDRGHHLYQVYCEAILGRQELLEPTRVTEQLAGNFSPIVVRLLLRKAVHNLIFYDPAGELVQELDKSYFLTYLRHCASIICTVAPPTRPGDPEIRAASEALGNVIKRLREQLQVFGNSPIPKSLAVVLTKADEEVFRLHPPESITPGYARPQSYWSNWCPRDRDATVASNNCKQLLRGMGFNNLVNLAEFHFQSCAFFAVSSLGHSPSDGKITPPVEPIGVECPLFWCLSQVK